MKKKTKKTLKFIFFILLLFILGELYLRHFQGLADAPIYIESEEYEYISAPNQDGSRFGNHYHYNSYSQRNEEPDSTKQIILGLGDSVLFGGMQSDQDSIATSIFTKENKHSQMLNISAGSWGPDNCSAYLKEKGIFNATKMFLVVSSHDAHDNMDFKPVVGVHKSYPNKKYKLAFGELFERYLIPKITKKFNQIKELDPDQKVLNGINIKKKGKIFNPGFEELKSISDSISIPLIIYLHADKMELKDKKYNEQGEEIINWSKENNIKIIQELDYNFSESDYRDGIHLNNNGQRKLANIMNGHLK